jgi:hypothetical protein
MSLIFQKAVDIAIRNGALSLLDFYNLQLLNRSCHTKYNDLEERLAFVSVMQGLQSTRGQWDDKRSKVSQFRFWQACLLTPNVLRALEKSYGITSSTQSSFYSGVSAMNAGD